MSLTLLSDLTANLSTNNDTVMDANNINDNNTNISNTNFSGSVANNLRQQWNSLSLAERIRLWRNKMLQSSSANQMMPNGNANYNNVNAAYGGFVYR